MYAGSYACVEREAYMAKIQLNNMTYFYEDYYYPVFENVNLVLDSDWKLGLIGRNGRGKTTLLRLLQGQLQPTSGVVTSDVQMELFPYRLETTYVTTLEVVKEYLAGLTTLEKKMERLLQENTPQALREYEEVLTQYLEADGYMADAKIRRELQYMGMEEELLDREYQTLSGGERTRIQIIAMFLREDTFVLLDEPTEHLDSSGKQLLAQYLKGKKGYIVVSHDKAFLDEVTDHILSINKATIELEKGTYSSWQENMERKENFELKVREKLQKEIKQLERASEKQIGWAGVANQQKYEFACHARANGAKSYYRQVKRAKEQIQDDLEQKKQLLRNMEESRNLVLQQMGTEEQVLICCRDFSYSYGTHSVLENVSLELERGDRLWLRGRNGSGKSTLLRLLMDASEDAELAKKLGIHLAEGIKMVYVSQDAAISRGMLQDVVSNKEQYDKVIELCKAFDISRDMLQRPMESFSSGELRKLNLAIALTQNQQVLLLDEPLNYMDVLFREQLKEAIVKYEPTLILVEHEEIFARNVATKEYAL